MSTIKAALLGTVISVVMLVSEARSATALDNYKRLQNEAHAFMNQLDYESAAAKFILAGAEAVKPIWRASALHNAGVMLRLAGKTPAEVRDLLNQALAVLATEDPADKTVILIKTRANRIKTAIAIQ